MARRGKIARLPKAVRDELNTRLQDGEVGSSLLEWLNGLPEVQQVLTAHFKGELINDVNLSAWRTGGFAEWERAQDVEGMLQRVREEADGFDGAVGEVAIGDCMGKLVAAEIAGLARVLWEKEEDPEKRWNRVCKVHKQISRLRKDDHREVRVMIKRDEWERAVKAEEKESDRPQLTPLERAERIKQIYGNM